MREIRKIYRYKKGDRLTKVKCPFCGKINVWAAAWGDEDCCEHKIEGYCKEYPSILPEHQYTRVFVFQGEVK